MKVETLEKKFAPAASIITLPGRELHSVVASLIDNLEQRNFGLSHAVSALKTNRKINEADALALISRGKSCSSEGDREKFKQACDNLEKRMMPRKKLSDEVVIQKALK